MTDASTNMSPDWIARVVRENPFRLLENGNIRTCPVRLSFPNVFKRSKPIPPNTEGKFGANLIIPAAADLSVLRAAAAECAKAKWPTVGTSQAPKLKLQIKPQSENAKFEGYGEEGFFLTSVADRQPPFVDQRLAPITDETKAYPGAWVIAAIRPFAYDMGVNKGVSFGLQSLMFIADDKQLGGGGSNPQADFAGVSIDASVNPADAFGAGEQQPAAADSIFG